MENCRNCGSPLNGGEKFCSNCGQKIIEGLRLKTLLGELAAAFLSWDSKLFKTMRLLLFKPGQVSKNYIKGQRKGYVAPMRIYIFFSVVFFLLMGTFGANSGESDGDPNDANSDVFSMNFNGDSLSMNKDTLLLMDKHDRLDELEVVKEQETEFGKKLIKQSIRLQIKGKSFKSLIRSNFSIMLFVLIPLFALYLKIGHRNNKLDYIEHLIYALYFHSFMFFCFSLILGLSYLIRLDFVLLGMIALLIGYLLVGTKRFYGRSWIRTITKFLGLLMVYFLTASVFTFITLIITLLIY